MQAEPPFFLLLICNNFDCLFILLIFKVLFAPNNSTNVAEVMQHIEIDNNLASSAFLGFANYSLLHEYYRVNSNSVFAGLLFGSMNESIKNGEREREGGR